MQDSEAREGESVAEDGDGLTGERPAVSYRELYTALGQRLDERSVLLLYNLLNTCQRFRNYLHVCG